MKLEQMDSKRHGTILITLDGVRRTEIEGNIDDIIVWCSKQYKQEKLKRFTTNSAIPFIQSCLRNNIAMYIRDVTLENPYGISYPGYNEMLTGSVDPKINTNDTIDNPNQTFFETLDIPKDIIISTSWVQFRKILNVKRSGLYPLFMISSNELQPFIPNGYEYTVLPHIDSNSMYRSEHDSITYARFKEEWLKRDINPRYSFLSLDGTDHWAHTDDYYQYLNHIYLVDQIIQDIWYNLRPKNIVITTDHGRGHHVYDWQHHGKVKGSEECWCIIMGDKKETVIIPKDMKLKHIPYILKQL